MQFKKYVWPVIGLAAVVFSVWLLYKELRGVSWSDMTASLSAIPPRSWLLSALATLVAYGALAGYDRVALMHLRKHVSWLFIAVTSFTTYALSHNIGASVFSGAVVRYRAYSSRGLNGHEIGILVAFCSFTFMLGTLLLAGVVLVIEPDIVERFVDILPLGASRTTGFIVLGLIAIYFAGSLLGFRSLKFARFELSYPRPRVVLQQLWIAPLELLGAAGIIYFALPEVGNPGYFVVLGIFLVSFSAALMSHAPGGLGVLELVFITGLPDMDPADVLAALIVFRLFYLLVPFMIALIVILVFERSQLNTHEDPK